eukprot:6131905-Pleurochrysis_carterae.AAC.2
MQVFFEAVLTFGRERSAFSRPEWKQTAQLVLCMTCNSAASERVFALLAHMFGEKQASMLSDQLQASLMLAGYNARKTG